jgi:NAD(P)-dependent dehydrogenase (short-subunit alcohol dehydrogenase family)
MSDQGRLAGKKALVTGSGTGIGRGIALEFAREGADVVLHYGRSADGAESAVKEIEAMGRRAAALQANFENVEEAVDLGNRAVEFLGGIDCLVNNSGITMNKPFLKVTREQYNTLMNVNFGSPYFMAQRIVEEMLGHGGGAIVNLTSIHGVAGAPEHSVYAATKGAIIAYTRTLGVELAHKGVRVNAIAPGWVNVENHAKAIPGFNLRDAAESARNAVPVGRFGLPIDIAKLAVFLCTEDAGFIVGQTIVVDGGTSSLMSLISDFRSESPHRFGTGYLPGI